MSWTVPIRAAARPAWRALQAALEDAGPTACRDRIEWISDDLEDREYAVHHCVGCPVMRLCGEYANIGCEKDGVWGGVDRAASKNNTSIPLFDSQEETA